MTEHNSNNPASLNAEELLRFLNEGPAAFRPSQPREKSCSSSADERSQNPNSEPCTALGITPERYMRVTLGTADAAEAEELLSHAATCGDCGTRLASCLKTLEGNPSPEETTAIAEMAAARAEWQRRLASDLAATTARKRLGLFRLGLSAGQSPGWRFAGAAVAAGLAAVACLLVWQRETSTPDRELAQAYTQSRNLELRIPEADFAAIAAGAHTRGPLADREPAPLLEARARLARELEHKPQDAHWLQLQARADILGERYDAAADVLDRLLATGPVTSELLVDAASAYYQRGLLSGSELDRSTALDYLRRADELSPTDPVVLFNEAIVMEDRGQMMNAVEVWNRFITVERDPKWAAEGKRKLAALEQTLNRLKSHDSRVRQMLATPEAMDALAADPARLGKFDEELSSMQLDRVLNIAFPEAPESPHNAIDPTARMNASAGTSRNGQARGSPCNASCLSARKLLKAIAISLETQHHDSWLADLLPPDIDSLPPAAANTFARALRLLGQATREDQTGVPANGLTLAAQARNLFQNLGKEPHATPPLRLAAQVGERRAAVESMFALQRQADFRECRLFAHQLRMQPQPRGEAGRYPWMESVALLTEGICDDTPDTRQAIRSLQQNALQDAEASRYRLLTSRIQIRFAGDALNSHDLEAAESLTLATARELYATDAPPFRIFNTIGYMPFIEQDSPRPWMTEACFRETVRWAQLAGSHTSMAHATLLLARAEMRIGAMKEAEKQLRLAQDDRQASGQGSGNPINFTEDYIFFANSSLQRGDLNGAAHYLDLASRDIKNYSDSWGLRTYSATSGLLELKSGNLANAASTLQSQIHFSEGRLVDHGDASTAAEYGEQDHDLYAELVAVWLAQGRSPESALALWERFRLRSRGLAIAQCTGDELDCDLPALRASQSRLGGNLLIGQILLLDRILVYRVDKNEVRWSQKMLPRQDVLDRAQSLERAVSSPFTSMATAEQLGSNLSDALLPSFPVSMSPDATLLLESDPLLTNLSWPVLPTPAGPLGLQYPLEEERSMLITTRDRGSLRLGPGFQGPGRALVVGASVTAEGELPLPEALEEARSASQILPGSNLLLGQDATASHVAAALGTATIFHFAGHAAQTGKGTELLLAASSAGKSEPVDGAFLRLHPPRACRLAVLSACATGKREFSWNHPFQDIVETLGSLGVPEVVATRWQIDSEASVPFIDAFYKSLEHGSSVAIALTSARRLQFKNSSYSNPYYWGAYYSTRNESIQSGGNYVGKVQAREEAKKRL